MKYIIIFYLVSLTASSQSKKDEIYLTKDSDTTFWKKIQNEDIKTFKLPKLDTNNEFVFRIWNLGNLIEIKSNNNVITGKIIFFVFEVWEDNYKADTFVKEYELTSSCSKSLFEYIVSSDIAEIPSDKYIKDWSQGFDGFTYIYESLKNNNYSFKKFWTPKSQKFLKEAQLVNEFNEQIKQISNLDLYVKKFESEIPFYNYKYSGTSYVISKIRTKKEWREYRKERNRKHKFPN